MATLTAPLVLVAISFRSIFHRKRRKQDLVSTFFTYLTPPSLPKLGTIKYPIINHYLTLLFISESCKNKAKRQ